METETPRALNILVAGTDSGTPDELARLVEGGWEPGAMRSDTIMMLHVTADREQASVVSIPRDTWVEIPGHRPAKINAAFSLGGPALYVDTVEAFTGVDVDHVAIVDWAGFRDISTAVGGVDVTVPATVTDTMNDITWTAGQHHLEGQEALMYVRMRYGLGDGDFDRIDRQQNFLRSLLGKLVDEGTVRNPVRLTAAVNAITSSLTLDTSFDNAAVRDLALSLRGLRARDITFVTVPLQAYDKIEGQSVVRVDREAASRLFRAMDRGRLPQYAARTGLQQLPGPGQVN